MCRVNTSHWTDCFIKIGISPRIKAERIEIFDSKKIDSAPKKQETKFVLYMEFPNIKNFFKKFPVIINRGYPGECAMPRELTASESSPESRGAVAG